ncbi:MAG: hypothetical protein MUC96_10760 [Myxococcaceae bacterium]|jgi:hypothetical protein|nr:hypothetical protein [Myxococcaceae bacterium]
MISSLLVLALAAAPTVSVQFDGPLKQGLTTIAQQGGLNVIVVGALDEPAQIHLTDASPQEALETVARVYGLEVTKQGSLYVLRRAPAGTPPVAVVPPAPLAPPTPPGPATAPAPAVPLLAPSEPKSPEALEAEREALEAERERMERLTEQLEDDAERKAEALAERDEAAARLAEAKQEHLSARARNGELTSTGGPVVVKAGETVKHAVAYGGPVVVESGARVSGDAVAFGGDVVLKDKAEVGGDAVAFGGRVVREGVATVRGEEVSFGGSGIASAMAAHAVKANEAVRPADDERAPLSLATFLVQFVVFFVFGFVLMVLAPQRMKGLEAAIRTQPVVSGVVGFLALLLAIPLTLFLLITLIGIPVAAVLWLALAFVVPMGLAAIANAVGTAMPLGKVRRTQAMVLAVGLFILLVAMQVPVLGPLLMSLAVCVSLGAALRTRLGATPKGLPVAEPVQQLGV